MKFGNQYLTYNEYKELKGNLSEMPFNLLEYRAEKEVDELTLLSCEEGFYGKIFYYCK